MAKKQKRMIQPYETRDFTVENIRGEVDTTTGQKVLYGFIPYNERSESMGFYEIITPSAFTKSIQEADIFALVAHDSSKVLGSTQAGTLKLNSTENGLEISCVIPNTTYANDAYEIISRGDVKTMSFGFTPVKVETVGDVDYLVEVKLMEVSFMVTFPAYSATDSIAVTRQRYIKERRGLDIQKLSAVLAKEELNSEETAFLGEFAKKLFASIGMEVEEREGITEPPKSDSSTEPKPDDKATSADDAIAELKAMVEIETLI
jgi:hypothetical protein